jgi:uncharacterized protein GlcG (DUF336 family)
MPRTTTRRSITTGAAESVVAAARRRAEELDVAVNIAVVDDTGLLTVFCRMDGATGPAGEIAQDKAYTAAGFGMPTEDWAEFIKDDPTLVVGALTGIRRLIVFAGGHPLRVDGVVVGAVGVSGGTPDQDAELAQVAARCFDSLPD